MKHRRQPPRPSQRNLGTINARKIEVATAISACSHRSSSRRLPLTLAAAALSFLPPCLSPAQTPTAQPAPAASLPAAPAADPSLPSIQRLIDRGDTAAALQQLGPLAARQPVPPGVLRLEGQAFYAANQYASADKAFAAAFAQDPHDLESLQMRGLTLFRLGRPADAIPLLSKAQQWGPQTRVDPSYVLALCYLDTRRYDDARHAFALQYGFDPDSARSYLLSARMLLRRDFVPVAEQFARKALELDPQLPLAHELLGEVALSGNHIDQALSEFTAEQQHDPLEAGLYDRIGDAYVRSGKYQEASQWLQRAVLLEPTATGPYILLGKVLLKQGSPANAILYLEHATSMDPGNYMAHGLLSQAYRSTGRTDDALREAKISEKLQGESEPKLQTSP